MGQLVRNFIIKNFLLELLGNEINEKSDDIYLSKLRLEKIGIVF